MISGNKRIDEVDILRGIAAMLMILGHSFIVYPIDISTIFWCAAIQQFIYTFHMELFFLLAGCVYYCKDYKKFMQKKAKRIAIPYLFFGFVALLLRAFGGATINDVEPLGEGVWKLFFSGGGYWFLYVLFIIFAIFPWIEKVLSQKWMLLILAAALLILSDLVKLPSVFLIANIIHYIPYFILGHCISSLCEWGGYERKTNWILPAVIPLLLFLGLNWLEVSGTVELGSILAFIRAISIIAFLYSIVKILGSFNKDQVLKRSVHSFLLDCSRYSLQLYLFNGYLLVIFRILICQVLSITIPVVIVLGIWVGNLAVTLIACKWVLPRIPVVKSLCGL